MKEWLPGLLAGLAAGGTYGLGARFLADREWFHGYAAEMTLAFLFVVPIVVGFLTVRPQSSPSWLARIVTPWLAIMVGVIAAVLTGMEGTICVFMATPILLLMSTLGGIVGGIRRMRRGDVTTVAICLPLVLTPMEQLVPTPQAPREVRTEIDVAAPASLVWREIASVRPIAASERRPALFTAIGFPAPIAATLDRPGVGGVRRATFTGGLVFVETVTTWSENDTLAFSIDPNTDAIPPTTLDRHVTIGGPYFDVLDGTYRIEDLGGGRTRLHLASRTRVSTHFNVYAGAWSDAVMGSIQRNILHVIRGRAEAAAAARRGATPAPAAG
jgi:hypothetical protein